MISERPIAPGAEYHFFLSFCGVDSELARRVHGVLEAEGYKVFYSDENIRVGDNFVTELDTALVRSERMIALWTKNYRSTDWSSREYSVGLIHGKLLILVCDSAPLTPFASMEVHQVLRTDAGDAEFERCVASLADQKQVRVTHVAYRRHFTDAEGFGRRDILQSSESQSFRFFGRQAELTALDEAWESRGAQRVVCIIADGGYGKTTVAQKWIADNLDGLKADIYAYSFYNQALESRESLDSTAFLDDAYKFFFSVDANSVPSKNEVKLKALLLRLKERPCVLVLDGLEPMQVQREGREFGQIRDDYLRRFLREFAETKLPGLLIVTSRLPVTDLGALMVERGPVWQRKLPPLSEMESLELLAALGVSLERDQLARLAATLEFQPLLLTVYGTEAARRGIASLEKFDLYHEILKDIQASVSDKITRFVLRTLPDLTPAEKSLLFAISLFDAPPTSKQLNMLLGVGSVPHVTDGLVEKRRRLSRSNTFADRLREAEAGLQVRRLLRVETLPAPPLGNKSYQMHALVHGGAREILRNQYVPSWKEANRLVFKALKRSVRPHYPDRREDLLTLYSAVPFGVRSGRGKAAGWMYATRCLRGFRAYSTSKHGMIYQDIEILSHFFEGDWQSVKQGIGLSVSDQTQAVVWAGTLICAVNKYRIGRPLLEVGIQMAKDDRNFVTAARSARNLSYMCALHGDLEDAARLCADSVEYASNTPKFIYKIIELLNGIRVSPQFQLMASLVTLGYIHHFLGRTAEAQDFFSRGEAVQAAVSRRYPELRAVWCQRYCEFLVDTGRAAEAYARAERALIDPEKPKGWGEGAFAAPVVALALVRAATRLFEEGTPTLAIDKMLQMIDDAEGRCAGSDEPPPGSKAGAKPPEEKGGKMTWLRPVFRIARARLLRHLRRHAEAGAELDRAEKDCGEMGTELYIPDIDLERARISAARGESDAARRALEHARSRAGAMGLRCRDAEFAELGRAVDGNPDLAEQHRRPTGIPVSAAHLRFGLVEDDFGRGRAHAGDADGPDFE